MGMEKRRQDAKTTNGSAKQFNKLKREAKRQTIGTERAGRRCWATRQKVVVVVVVEAVVVVTVVVVIVVVR